MPPARRASRPRSPCTPQSKRLPKYKLLARDLPPGSLDTSERYRYQANPRGPGRPCVVVGDTAQGRTNCYAPTAHSRRRKTCELLVDPANPLHDFEPGLYLVPGPRFEDETLVCSAVDIIMGDSEDVDTRRAPPSQPVVVLGPYPHPVTGRLVVKCILLSTLENVQQITPFGQLFEPLDQSERGCMVPNTDMIRDFVGDLQASNVPNKLALISDVTTVRNALVSNERDLETLDQMCSEDPVFERHVRNICKCFYQMGLYYRRWGGPGCKVPLLLLDEVGSRSNPISPDLRGKFVKATMTGVRLTSNETNAQAADVVVPPEGTLVTMAVKNGEAILMIFDALTDRQRAILMRAFRLGTRCRMVNGNGRYYLDTVDPNIWNGNPRDFRINLFDMCFGTSAMRRGFYAVASVQGTQTYCVQVASVQIVRAMQTVLPYIYKSRPAWALVDGEFDNTHT